MLFGTVIVKLVSLVQTFAFLFQTGYTLRVVVIPPPDMAEPLPYHEYEKVDSGPPVPYVVLEHEVDGVKEEMVFYSEDDFAVYLDSAGLLYGDMTPNKWREWIETRAELIEEQKERDVRHDFWNDVESGKVTVPLNSDGSYDYTGAWEEYTRNLFEVDGQEAPLNDAQREWILQFP